MRDQDAAVSVGLVVPDEKTCFQCHNGECPVPADEFDFEKTWAQISHPTKSLKPKSVAVEYKTPFNLTLSRDGRRAYVACEGSDSLIILDLENRKVISEIEVGHQPHAVCLNPAETVAYVSNRGSDTVSVVDLAAQKVAGTITVGDEPHGITTDTSGDTIYVVNAGTSDVSVIDAGELKEVKRLRKKKPAKAAETPPEEAPVPNEAEGDES